MNLQLFAQEKTEKATPRRRQKARERGQVFSSREFTSALMLLVGILILKFLGPYYLQNLINLFINVLENHILREDIFTIKGLQALFIQLIIFAGKILLPLLLSLLITGVFANYIQIGTVFSPEAISFKLERINPIEGFKRIFSKRSLVELIKSIIKIFIVGYVVYSTAEKNKDVFPLMLDMEIMSSLRVIADIIFVVGLKAAITLIILSIFDYLYQWYEYEVGLMMSKEDIKEEFKEVEGDPQIKSKMRQKQRQFSRSRMMKNVQKADVVITNPTHFAVALIYDPEKYPAPLVLAKGADLLAKKIKKIASEENIPVVENKPLARTLYNTVEIGDIIPEHLYNAVAEVLAFVYSLKERRI